MSYTSSRFSCRDASNMLRLTDYPQFTDELYLVTWRVAFMLRRRNFKTMFLLWKRIESFPFTLGRRNLKRTNHRPRSGKSHEYRDVIVFESVLRPLGLVCTVGITVEMKLRFQFHQRSVDSARRLLVFENDGVTLIMWFSWLSFPQIQIRNDLWLIPLQIRPT